MNTVHHLVAGPGAVRRTLVVAAVLAALSLGAATASAQEQRLHQINWTHATPTEVGRFVILISPVEGSISDARQIDVGVPAPTPIGATNLYSAMVSFAPNEFLAVAAVGHNGLMSAPSDWSGMPPSRPGQPLPVGN